METYCVVDHGEVIQVKAFREDIWVGHLDFLASGETGLITSVWVDERYRRQGIATRLLAYARDVESQVHHSPDRSLDGQLWAQSTGDTLPEWKPQPDYHTYISAREVSCVVSFPVPLDLTEAQAVRLEQAIQTAMESAIANAL